MTERTRDELAAILEGIDTAVVVVDRDWRLTYFNAAADTLLRQLGRTGEALSGKMFWLEFPELVGTVCEREFRRAFVEGVTVDFDTHYPPLDRWLRIHATPMREGLAVSLADITLRNLAERTRRELEDFFDNATVGLHWGGPDGIVLRVNQAELDLLGYAREEYVGHHIAEFHVEPERIAEILQRLGRGETLRNEEARLRCKDGAIRHVVIDSSVRWGPNGEFLHTRCFTRDVTALKRVEEERVCLLASERAARAEAEAANRSKDEFLATLSHELRTPLTAVLGWTLMARRTKLDPGALQRALQAIERNTRAQTQLINDLLDVSRIITGKLDMQREPVHVLSTIETAIESVAESAGRKRITIEKALDPAAGFVLGDDMRLSQVVTNLVGNAVKFTPDGGHVAVRLEEIEDEAVITVTDDGVGIVADDLPRVFDRFHQGHVPRRSSLGGLGLGLAIVQHLVKQHGGRVTAESDGPGMGARFTVSLPRIGPSPSSGRRRLQAVPLDDVELRGVDVLVVEDDPDSREIIRGDPSHARSDGASRRLRPGGARRPRDERPRRPDQRHRARRHRRLRPAAARPRPRRTGPRRSRDRAHRVRASRGPRERAGRRLSAPSHEADRAAGAASGRRESRRGQPPGRDGAADGLTGAPPGQAVG
jgi:PAS domain S-box-containing protein